MLPRFVHTSIVITLGVPLSLAALCLGAGAQLPEPQVAGRVVRADNSLPIEGAAVQLEPAGSPVSNGQFLTAITDANGRYRFLKDVQAGVYLIKASADGFVSQTYSRDGTLEGNFQRVDVSTRLHGIDFQLKREAVIRGELTDAEGKPAGPGISVAAVRKEKRENGSPRLLPVTWVKTDASGRFMLTKLPSGTYFVCVNGPNGFNAFPDAEGWYRETWYGNVDSVEGSIPLMLTDGEERNNVRITVEREPRYRVIVWPSGPEGQPTPEWYDVRIETRSHTSSRQADGSYVIPGIPPGHYKLVSIAWSEAGYLGEGDVNFVVTNADVTLHLHVGGLGEIRGVVKSDDTPGGVPPGVMIAIASEEGAEQAKDADADGQVLFGRVLPGRYRFELLKKPDGVVLRSVTCGGVKVTSDAPLRMHDGQKVTDCELLLGHNSR